MEVLRLPRVDDCPSKPRPKIFSPKVIFHEGKGCFGSSIRTSLVDAGSGYNHPTVTLSSSSLSSSGIEQRNRYASGHRNFCTGSPSGVLDLSISSSSKDTEENQPGSIYKSTSKQDCCKLCAEQEGRTKVTDQNRYGDYCGDGHNYNDCRVFGDRNEQSSAGRRDLHLGNENSAFVVHDVSLSEKMRQHGAGIVNARLCEGGECGQAATRSLSEQRLDISASTGKSLESGGEKVSCAGTWIPPRVFPAHLPLCASSPCPANADGHACSLHTSLSCRASPQVAGSPHLCCCRQQSRHFFGAHHKQSFANGNGSDTSTFCVTSSVDLRGKVCTHSNIKLRTSSESMTEPLRYGIMQSSVERKLSRLPCNFCCCGSVLTRIPYNGHSSLCGTGGHWMDWRAHDDDLARSASTGVCLFQEQSRTPERHIHHVRGKACPSAVKEDADNKTKLERYPDVSSQDEQITERDLISESQLGISPCSSRETIDSLNGGQLKEMLEYQGTLTVIEAKDFTSYKNSCVLPLKGKLESHSKPLRDSPNQIYTNFDEMTNKVDHVQILQVPNVVKQTDYNYEKRRPGKNMFSGNTHSQEVSHSTQTHSHLSSDAHHQCCEEPYDLSLKPKKKTTKSAGSKQDSNSQCSADQSAGIRVSKTVPKYVGSCDLPSVINSTHDAFSATSVLSVPTSDKLSCLPSSQEQGFTGYNETSQPPCEGSSNIPSFLRFSKLFQTWRSECFNEKRDQTTDHSPRNQHLSRSAVSHNLGTATQNVCSFATQLKTLCSNFVVSETKSECSLFSSCPQTDNSSGDYSSEIAKTVQAEQLSRQAAATTSASPTASSLEPTFSTTEASSRFPHLQATSITIPRPTCTSISSSDRATPPEKLLRGPPPALTGTTASQRPSPAKTKVAPVTKKTRAEQKQGTDSVQQPLCLSVSSPSSSSIATTTAAAAATATTTATTTISPASAKRRHCPSVQGADDHDNRAAEQNADQPQHVRPVASRRNRLRTYQCSMCNVACSNRGQLQGHLRTHTGERPFPCLEPGCSKTFVRNEELTRHRRIHSGERPFPCVTCGKAFTRKDHLNKHLRMHLKTAADSIEPMELS